MSKTEYLPKDIMTGDFFGFMGSKFENTECEIVARNILLLLNKVNPYKWTSFSWEEYKEFCRHEVSDKEFTVMMAMVEGGRPCWNTSKILQPGYLLKTGDRFEISDTFIDALPEEVKKQKNLEESKND